jgi:hypothetical protein
VFMANAETIREQRQVSPECRTREQSKGHDAEKCSR